MVVINNIIYSWVKVKFSLFFSAWRLTIILIWETVLLLFFAIRAGTKSF